jgi:hypothetical protein
MKNINLSLLNELNSFTFNGSKREEEKRVKEHKTMSILIILGPLPRTWTVFKF